MVARRADLGLRAGSRLEVGRVAPRASFFVFAIDPSKVIQNCCNSARFFFAMSLLHCCSRALLLCVSYPSCWIYWLPSRVRQNLILSYRAYEFLKDRLHFTPSYSKSLRITPSSVNMNRTTKHRLTFGKDKPRLYHTLYGPPLTWSDKSTTGGKKILQDMRKRLNRRTIFWVLVTVHRGGY